jgi:hypothetical protein
VPGKVGPKKRIAEVLLGISREVSVVDPVGIPVTGASIAIETIDTAIAELDIPVVSVSRGLGPPVFFQTPWTGGDLDLPPDGGVTTRGRAR